MEKLKVVLMAGFLFNHEDIEEVISKGYTDETWEDFIKRMREFYKEI